MMSRDNHRMTGLTPRQEAVYCLICKGWSNEDIARHFVIEIRTVERHITDIYEVFGLEKDLSSTLKRTRAVIRYYAGAA
jgi:DNA-binding NarL/FixJ family response regulator